MTKREAEAAEVVVRWAFSRGLLDPEALARAFLVLAAGISRAGGTLTPDEVRTWMP